MYGTLLVSDLSISFSIFIVVVFSWLFLRHNGYIYLCYIVCCETDSGFKVLENDVGYIFEHDFIWLGFGKLGFVKRLLSGERLRKSGREVLREGIFENKNIIFHINYATH